MPNDIDFDTDELEGDKDFFSNDTSEKKDSNPTTESQDESQDTRLETPGTNTSALGLGNIPDLRGGDYTSSFMDLVKRIQVEYSLLPNLDYNAIYNELSELAVPAEAAPSLQVINSEIQLIQASKDRLAEIFINVFKCHSFKKRAVDIMIESWNKYSDEKSADKRRGDSSFRFSNFILDIASLDSLLKSCQHILKNLESSYERLSKTVTIWQLTLKVDDIGRGALPNSTFDAMNAMHDHESMNDKFDSIRTQKFSGDPSESIQAVVEEDDFD